MIFISHNIADKEVARNLALFLVAEDTSVWFDEWEISAGDSIVEQIEVGLKGCSHFLLLWSNHAARSNWVRKELRSTLIRAIEHGTPRVIPVLLDNEPLPELLADLKYLRYHGGSEDDRRSLIAEILGIAPSQSFMRAVVRKYREVIIDEHTGEYRGCPDCGSSSLQYSQYDDPETLDTRVVVECQDCGWGVLWA